MNIPEKSKLSDLATRTREVYEQHGAAFDQQRPKNLYEKKWLDRFIARLPENASILDVGCGAGEPFIPYFLSRGLSVEGLEFAESMLEIVRERFPDLVFYPADMSDFTLGRKFDGIIAWNSFFHLTKVAQRKALVCFSQHLNPGGALMLTVGGEDGEVVGHVNGAEVYHSSLAPDDYRSSLATLGIEVVEFVIDDEECGQQTVLIGQKSGCTNLRSCNRRKS
ncbi:MAG: class I SAM-dependent methyltransferase [Gammaproteobacteria bacterium]